MFIVCTTDEYRFHNPQRDVMPSSVYALPAGNKQSHLRFMIFRSVGPPHIVGAMVFSSLPVLRDAPVDVLMPCGVVAPGQVLSEYVTYFTCRGHQTIIQPCRNMLCLHPCPESTMCVKSAIRLIRISKCIIAVAMPSFMWGQCCPISFCENRRRLLVS